MQSSPLCGSESPPNPRTASNVGGEGGWEPSQHKYVWSAGGFAHTDGCDHAIRAVRAPTLEDLEWARSVSPG